MNMNPITMDREYRTRRGNPVKLFTVAARDTYYPVRGEYFSEGGWQQDEWRPDGRFLLGEQESDFDLVEVQSAEHAELSK
jgi:hypothetical protein